MDPVFTTWGALAGLVLAIVLIVRRTPPAYALIFAALVGGLLGGGGLAGTVDAMLAGAKGMMSPILRILASGVLAGALIKTGAAAKLADAIVRAFGTRFALAAVAVATMVVCAVGVFVDIAVITVAPVALAVGRRTGGSVSALLLAMIGGGKAGNIISPNPNTIAAADAFKVDLTALMLENVVPAAVALVVTVLLAMVLAKRSASVSAFAETAAAESAAEPTVALWAALAGPIVVVALLALRPICGVAVDPLIALPAGGLVSILAAGRVRETIPFAEFGLSKVAGVAILLIGTGTIAGVIKASGLTHDMIALLTCCHLPAFALAPVSGVLMAGATASTTAGATVASQTFSEALLGAG
ncbi:MAG: GntP family permease, partial [Kiritimatiellae bacterium]|nr:GntP family permease [Kiritimatiellia bacterium]